MKTGKFTAEELLIIQTAIAEDSAIEPEALAAKLNRAVRPVKGAIARLKAANPKTTNMTEAQQLNSKLLVDQLGLSKWLADFVVTAIPYDKQPEHALKLYSSPTCYLTGAQLVEDRASNFGVFYIPDDDIVVCRLAAKIKGTYPAKEFIKWCNIVAANARIDTL